MTNFGYLRISTSDQDINNQKLGILDYCNQRALVPLTLVEDTVSGKLSWRERGIGKIMEQSQKGDIVVVAEVSRLGRSTLQVLEILQDAAQKQVSIHIVKNHLVMDGSLQATITATILGLAAQIEREFLSLRTKEALTKRKAEGIKLGRPAGPSHSLKLDTYREEIEKYLAKGINKRSIAKLVDCAPGTLYLWLKRQKKK